MKYKVGDAVRICPHPPTHTVIAWELGMDDHCAQVGQIISTDDSFGTPVYAVRSSSKYGVVSNWWYEEGWLLPIDEYYSEAPISVKQFQDSGLKELARAEAAAKSKRDEIFRKMFSTD
jgi:hypothetical protein